MTTLALTRIDPPAFAARRDEIAALDGAARAIDGHDSLGESAWRDITDPGSDSVGFLIESRAYIHVARDINVDRGSNVGRGESPGGVAHWTAGTIRLLEARDPATTSALLNAAVDHVAAHGGGQLECWVFGAGSSDNASFGAAGLTEARELFEMRVPLPLSVTAEWPPDVTMRAFRPGRDDADWLQVNNRAFADHPDQGDWTEATLAHRTAEPWFDPSLFLLAVDARGIAGFNWLKLHPPRDPDPALGEIYVIGVDPRAQGTGLGRALAISGLGAVHARGVTVGMLFCAADNAGALALYRSLGFTVHRTDRAYAREVLPA